MNLKNKLDNSNTLEIEDKMEFDYFFIIEKIGRKISQFGQKVLTEKNLDLTIDQWMVLKKVSECNGISQIEICKSLFKDAPTVTKILDLLCKKELVERKINATDRRKFDIFITKNGENIVEKFLPTYIETRKTVLDNLQIEDLYIMAHTLNGLSENMDKITDKF
ncbi:MAG: MarR family transcriptional regulator [Cyanobacteriota bacterium]